MNQETRIGGRLGRPIRHGTGSSRQEGDVGDARRLRVRRGDVVLRVRPQHHHPLALDTKRRRDRHPSATSKSDLVFCFFLYLDDGNVDLVPGVEEAPEAQTGGAFEGRLERDDGRHALERVREARSGRQTLQLGVTVLHRTKSIRLTKKTGRGRDRGHGTSR